MNRSLKGLISRNSFIPAYIFSLSIFVLASLPVNELGRIQKFPKRPFLRIMLSDAFMHFLVFGLLALLIYRGCYQKSKNFIISVIVALLAIGYGFLIEVYQRCLPWRSFGLDDLFWDTLGAIFFLTLVSVFRLRE